MSDVRALRVLLPPLSEQRAIASILEPLDDKIESNRRLAVRSLDMVQTAFARIAGQASRRVALSEIADELRTRIQPTDTPSEIFEQFSIPAFDAGMGPEVCSGSTMASAKTLLPPSSVVLVSKLNPTTKRVWWPERHGVGTAVCSPEFVALTPHRQRDAAWLFGCVAFDRSFYDQLLGAISGTTGSRQRVRPSDVLAASVPFVEPGARDDWDSLANRVLAQRVTLLRESRALTAIRDALLPKLVSGQIRVPLSNDPEEQVGAAIEALA
ncbi:hypothetical protein BDZ31_004408 [Conexibacter arvalis]|uniref:Type I restriction modification DNA specificity domain-containing protein n=1 Tax=Conexibacter arvalis TaxID=912552 RepID=A0A840IKX7_9ACTN|nr:hypothetical protein [Conexibacter arvalis]